MIARRGDHVPVLVRAADGWCYVMHDPAEYAALWKGVDVCVVAVIELDVEDD